MNLINDSQEIHNNKKILLIRKYVLKIKICVDINIELIYLIKKISKLEKYSHQVIKLVNIKYFIFFQFQKQVKKILFCINKLYILDFIFFVTQVPFQKGSKHSQYQHIPLHTFSLLVQHGPLTAVLQLKEEVIK